MVSGENAVALLVNGLTLAVALTLLIILLWHDSRSEVTQFFSVFLGLMMCWNLGSLLAQAGALVSLPSGFQRIPLIILELGFTGSSIALYALTAALVKVFTRRFRALVLLALVLFGAYRVLLTVSGAPDPFVVQADGALSMASRSSLTVFYLVFDGASAYLLWRFQRKIRSRLLKAGLVAFIVGQTIGFLNPELSSFVIATVIAAFAALVIGFGILQQQIIRPLATRKSEVEALRNVIGSIANQTESGAVLQQVARQAAQVIGADAVGILLLDGDELVLKTAWELGVEPEAVRLARGQGMAWQSVLTKQLVQVEDYRRDWKGAPDFPIATEVFGAVMCTPLIAGGDPLGAMMAVASKQGRMFDREDAYLLQLLAAQAAVAVTQGHLFHEQAALTNAVEQSRNQLETVLASTDSPVIAIDRSFAVIFANPAAQALFGGFNPEVRGSIAELLPASAFPANLRGALRELRRNRTLTYEAEFGEQVFLAHVARLGGPRVEGWVTVLNDITQLKELDRLKSEMVRMTSHDLKNPLQAAMSNLELLRDDVYDDGTQDVRESVDAIDRQLMRMNRIIRGILDLERVKNGVIALELCRPERIIKDAAQEMAEFAREHEVTLTSESAPVLPPVACDVEQFGRALINLVENAIKFTPSGGRVLLKAISHNGFVDFVVSDTGVGIAPDQQERVFDRFFRAKQKGVEHVSGSGLGLSLVKTIVANHKGQIWLDSEEKVGTTFTIRLSAAQDTGL